MLQLNLSTSQAPECQSDTLDDQYSSRLYDKVLAHSNWFSDYPSTR